MRRGRIHCTVLRKVRVHKGVRYGTLPTPSQYWAAMYLAKIAYTDETNLAAQGCVHASWTAS